MAIQFNLLPWREEKRQKHIERTRNALLLGAGLGLLAGIGYYAWEKVRLSDHEKAMKLISDKNKAMVPLLAEKKLLDELKEQLNRQIDAIESLQADRASVSHMVEELSNANQQELFLTQFDLSDGVVNIAGIAQNDSQISDLMKRLRVSRWYQEPKLLEIISQPDLGDEVKSFGISSKLLLPGTSLEKEGDSYGKKK